MKKLSLALCAVALVMSTVMRKPLHAAYANPVYSLYNGITIEKQKTTGCALSKKPGVADLVLFDDGTWALTGTINASGTWAAPTENVAYLAVNRMSDILSVVNDRATSTCNQPKTALTPTVMIKKMKLVKNSHGQGSFSLKMKGFDQDGKSFTYSYTIKGTVIYTPGITLIQ